MNSKVNDELLIDRSATNRGVVMAVLATVFYALVDALSKYQAREYPVEMIVWARYAVPLVLLLAVFLPKHRSSMLTTSHLRIQIIRGILLTAGTVFIVLALRVMPIAEAQAIFFIHPVLLTLLAVIFLRERVSALGWAAVLVGFSGVLIIVRPSGGLFNGTALLPLCLALSFSSYQIFTRIISGKEKSLNSLFYVLLVGSVVMSCALPFAWVDPTPRGLLMFVLIGVISGLGHFSTIKALELAPASMLAPFAYIQLLWVSILGILIFGDFPDTITFVGIIIVVAGGFLVIIAKRNATQSVPR